MLRGGSWNNNATNLRVSNRNNNDPAERNNNIGFRCVRDEERGRGMGLELAESWRSTVRSVPTLLPDRAPDAGKGQALMAQTVARVKHKGAPRPSGSLTAKAGRGETEKNTGSPVAHGAWQSPPHRIALDLFVNT